MKKIKAKRFLKKTFQHNLRKKLHKKIKNQEKVFFKKKEKSEIKF
jgi:hypothetical protein